MEFKFEIDDRLVAAAKKTFTKRRTLVAAAVLAFGSAIAYAVPIDPVANQFVDGTVIYADDMNGRFEFVMSAVTDLQKDVTALQTELAAVNGRWIATDTNWTVGPTGAYATLTEAFAALQQRRILPSAVLTITLEDGVHMVTPGLQMGHVDGDLVRVVGSSSAAVTLSLTGDTAYNINVTAGTGLGLLKGVTIDGNSGAATKRGVHVFGCHLRLDDVIVQGFGMTGVDVSSGGRLDANTNSGVAINNNGGAGLSVSGEGTHAYLSQASFVGNGSDGALVSHGGQATLTVCTFDGNFSGLKVLTGSYVRADSSIAKNNTDSGFQVRDGSILWCPTCTADLNVVVNYWSRSGGHLHAAGATSTNSPGIGFLTSYGAYSWLVDSSSTGDAVDYDPVASTADDYTTVYE